MLLGGLGYGEVRVQSPLVIQNGCCQSMYTQYDGRLADDLVVPVFFCIL